MNATIRQLREQRYFVLLCTLVGLMLVTPLAEIAELGFGPIELLWTLVLLSAVNAASARRIQLWAAVTLAVPALALNWIEAVTADLWIDGASRVLTIAMLLFTIGILLGPILRIKESNFDTICGAASIYLLFGLTWSVLYSLIEALAPGSFSNLSADAAKTWTQFLYFSLTTLTTLGYGEISPLTPVAHIWSTLEAVTGVLYVAILVAGLVGIYRRSGSG